MMKKTMRKLMIGILPVILMLSGCRKGVQRQISMEEIAEAYEQAGYQVAFQYYEEPMWDGGTAYLQAEKENGDYIYFRFFASEEEAKVYTDEMSEARGFLFFYSALSGDATWQRAKTYDCISITYFNTEDYEPFKMLLDKS